MPVSAPEKHSSSHKKRRRKDQPKTAAASSNAEKKNSAKSKAPPLPFGRCVGVSDRFRKCGRVGEGTYGVVYKAEDRQKPGDFVALKRCIAHHEASDGFPLTALREIQSLRLLQQHPHVISLRADIGMVAVSKNDVFLVFEYCEHDLAQLLDYHYHKQQRHYNQKHPQKKPCLVTSAKPGGFKSPLRESHVKTLMKHLLSAIECIHSHRLIHRDIKVSNLLYTASGHLKLADFGLSRSLPAQSAATEEGYHLTANVVSLWYRAPELLLGSKTYGQAIDLWSAACCFAELLQGYPLWMGKTEDEQMDSIFHTIGYPTAESWPRFPEMPLVKAGTVSLTAPNAALASSMPLLDSFSFLSSSGLLLLTYMLHYDTHQRWSATKALESPYFTSEPLPTPPSDMPKFKSLHK